MYTYTSHIVSVCGSNFGTYSVPSDTWKSFYFVGEIWWIFFRRGCFLMFSIFQQKESCYYIFNVYETSSLGRVKNRTELNGFLMQFIVSLRMDLCRGRDDENGNDQIFLHGKLFFWFIECHGIQHRKIDDSLMYRKHFHASRCSASTFLCTMSYVICLFSSHFLRNNIAWNV